MSEHMEPIPSMIYNSAVGGHVTNSQQIIDENLNREQQDINEEVAAVPYNSTTPNGMGKIVLKKTDNFKTVVESQTNGNTVFVIKYNFILTDDVTIPNNCVLFFDGGCIGNDNENSYAIKGMFTVNDVMYKIFDNITFIRYESVLKADHVRPEWFGAKGDFDVTNNTGTDDSAAISAAIRAAELLNVGKIQFASADYLVSTGAHIVKGNVWLNGTRALLRENMHYSDQIDSRGSTLWCTANTSIITCDTTVGGPLRFTNLQFRTFGDSRANTYGINFTSTYEGPTWPFLVQYCYFYQLDKAIRFSSTNKYCVYQVRITENAFGGNSWCVYFEELATDSIGFHSNLTWEFTFENNMAHQNSRNIKAAISHGMCRINNNNFEGNSASGEGDYLCDITISTHVNFEFTNNHFEVISAFPLRLECLARSMTVLIKGNNTNGIDAAYEKFLITTARNNVSNQTLIEIDSDKSIDFINIHGYVVVCCKNQFPLRWDGTGGAFVVAHKDSINFDNNSNITLIKEFIGQASNSFFASGNKILGTLGTYYVGVSPINPIAGKKNFIVISAFSANGTIPAVGFYYNGTPVWTHLYRFGDRRYPKVFLITPFSNTLNTNQLYIFNNENLKTSPVEVYRGEFSAEIADIQNYLHLNENNVVPASSVLASISNVMIGTKVIADKEYIYNGGWKDAAGTPV